MENVPNGVGVSTFTEAAPGADVAADVAVTVIAAGVGTTAGDVYSPDALIVPPPPVTAQVTCWFIEPFTVAANCCWVSAGGHEFPVSSAYRLTVTGLIVTTVPTISVAAGVAVVIIPSVP